MTALLDISRLCVSYRASRALDDVSLSIAPGERVGIVGESGSGKSTLGLAVMGLLDPAARISADTMRVVGSDLMKAKEPELRALRGSRAAMVFQDPLSTLNPLLKIGTQIRETIRAHRDLPPAETHRLAVEALRRVGLPTPADRMEHYPHQLSGGMRQRVAIAIAMINEPQLLIADEPTTALDVTIQTQVLATVKRLCRVSGTALMWISHDIGVVRYIATRIVVMWQGRIVEDGPVEQIVRSPAHPYTASLIEAVHRLHQAP